MKLLFIIFLLIALYYVTIFLISKSYSLSVYLKRETDLPVKLIMLLYGIAIFAFVMTSLFSILVMFVRMITG